MFGGTLMIQEMQGNVLEHITSNSPVAHCISADYALGAGVARLIDNKYHVREVLIHIGTHTYPDCIKVGNVLNIVTKQYYWCKPTYQTFIGGLEKLREVCKEQGITYIVMPRIGSGLDRLDWNICKKCIQEILVDSGIQVTVYYL